MSLTFDQPETKIIIQTPCQYLKLAIENVTAAVVYKFKPKIDLILFVDTRTIGRDKMPFLFTAKKILCIYLTDNDIAHTCNSILLNSKLSDFIRKINNLIIHFNTSHVQQAMFWAKNHSLLTLNRGELAVLYLLCKGLSVKQIAKIESINAKTVYGRMASVKRKTNFRSTPSLVLHLSSHCDEMLRLIIEAGL